jgi:hypothetical protein
MTIQEKTAERIYEILPHKKNRCTTCDGLGILQCGHESHFTNCNTTCPCFGEKECLDCEGSGYILYEPIRLADILLAIDYSSDIKIELDLSEAGNVLRVTDFNTDVSTTCNLSQDNLLNQSSDFCEMLLGLLGN